MLEASDQLAAIYSPRWLIQMAFRAWKQSGNMIKARDRFSSPQPLKSLMLAGVVRNVAEGVGHIAMPCAGGMCSTA